MEPGKSEAQKKPARSSLDEVSKFKTGEKKRPSWLSEEEEIELDSMFFEIYPDKNGYVDWSIERPKVEKPVQNMEQDKTDKPSTSEVFKVPSVPTLSKQVKEKLPSKNIKKSKRSPVKHQKATSTSTSIQAEKPRMNSSSSVHKTQDKCVLRSDNVTSNLQIGVVTDGVKGKIVGEVTKTLPSTEILQETQEEENLNIIVEAKVTQEHANQNKFFVNRDKLTESKNVSQDDKISLELQQKPQETENQTIFGKDCDKAYKLPRDVKLGVTFNEEKLLKVGVASKPKENGDETKLNKDIEFLDTNESIILNKENTKVTLPLQTENQTQLKNNEKENEKLVELGESRNQTKLLLLSMKESISHKLELEKINILDTKNKNLVVDECDIDSKLEVNEVMSKETKVNIDQEVNKENTVSLKETVKVQESDFNKAVFETDCDKQPSEVPFVNLDKELNNETSAKEAVKRQESGTQKKLESCDNLVKLSTNNNKPSVEIKLTNISDGKGAQNVHIGNEKSILLTTYLKSFRFPTQNTTKRVKKEHISNKEVDNKDAKSNAKNIEGITIEDEPKTPIVTNNSSNEKYKIIDGSKIVYETPIVTVKDHKSRSLPSTSSIPKNIAPKRSLPNNNTKSESSRNKYPKRSVPKVDYSADLFWDEEFSSDSSPTLTNKNTKKKNTTRMDNKNLVQEDLTATVPLTKSNKKIIFDKNNLDKSVSSLTITLNKSTETKNENLNEVKIETYVAICKNKCCKKPLSLTSCVLCRRELLSNMFIKHLTLEHNSKLSNHKYEAAMDNIENGNPIEDTNNIETPNQRKCAFCNDSFSTLTYLLIHLLARHDALTSYTPTNQPSNHDPLKSDCKCNICNLIFVNLFDYIDHMKYEHDYIIICNVTEIEINCKYNDNIEVTINENKSNNEDTSKNCNIKINELFTCFTCKESFESKDILSEHIQNDHLLKIRCDSCKYQFKNTFEFNNHIKVSYHKNNPDNIKIEYHYLGSCYKILCVTCNKWFDSKSGMLSHIRNKHKNNINESEKDHSCNLCKKSYTTKRGLSCHIAQMHKLQDETYKCNSCNYKYKNELKYNNHIIIKIKNNIKIEYHKISSYKRKILCVTCNEWFVNNYDISKHLNRKHNYGENTTVNPTNVDPTTVKTTTTDVKQKKLTCPHLECNFEVTNSNALLRHLSNKHGTSHRKDNM